jgi:Ser/Thr protein kinase RdoA (MazF antagonist)
MGPARVASRLRDAYGFDDVVIGNRLQGGYANDLFRIEADGRALVLRIMHPPALEGDIAWEHCSTRTLSERLREVSAPLAARGGATFVDVERRVAWLTPFVDGSPANAACERRRPARPADARAREPPALKVTRRGERCSIMGAA